MLKLVIACGIATANMLFGTLPPMKTNNSVGSASFFFLRTNQGVSGFDSPDMIRSHKPLLMPSTCASNNFRRFLYLLHFPIERGDCHFSDDVIGLRLIGDIDDFAGLLV